MTETLQDMMMRAEQRAVEEGYSSKGKERVLREQRISICNADTHDALWKLAGHADAKIHCGACHPPAAGLEVVWL